MAKKISLEEALESEKINLETKRKIKLSQEVRQFSIDRLHLKKTKNYDSFVQLESPYVTYAVTASPKNQITPYLWHFPIIGDVPYKGFFKKAAAEDEAEELKKKNLDVIVRGVSAYSTLGWFSDPLLSSMTRYEDHDLVETLIHETTHSTVYIASNADFNERLATFVGQTGMELFYLEKEGPNSPTLIKAKQEMQDEKVFFQFIQKEIKKLDAFYLENSKALDLENQRQNQFAAIKKSFMEQCRPLLKTAHFDYFKDLNLNNALLLNYKIYYDQLENFEKLYLAQGKSWAGFISQIEKLKDSKKPEDDLKKLISSK